MSTKRINTTSKCDDMNMFTLDFEAKFEPTPITLVINGRVILVCIKSSACKWALGVKDFKEAVAKFVSHKVREDIKVLINKDMYEDLHEVSLAWVSTDPKLWSVCFLDEI